MPHCLQTYSNCVSQVPTHTNSSFSTLLRRVHHLVLSKKKTHHRGSWMLMAPRYPGEWWRIDSWHLLTIFWEISTNSTGLPLPVGGRKAAPATVIKDTSFFSVKRHWRIPQIYPNIGLYWLSQLKVGHCGYLSSHHLPIVDMGPSFLL